MLNNSNDHEQRQRLKPLVALLKEGKPDQAIPLLKEYLQDFPANEVAMGMLASTYQQLGMSGSAKALYRKILAHNAENALARFQLGMMYFQDRGWEAALSEWHPLVEAGSDFTVLFYSGMCHLNIGYKGKAIQQFKASAKLMPRSHPLFASLESVALELDFSLS